MLGCALDVQFEKAAFFHLMYHSLFRGGLDALPYFSNTGKFMENKKYLWLSGEEYIAYTTRHLPKILHLRLKTQAAKRGHSLEKELNICLDLGLQKRERERSG